MSDQQKLNGGVGLRKRRIGRIEYKKEFSECEFLADAMGQCRLVPIRMEFQPLEQLFVMYAYSPDFREIAAGDLVPNYELHFTGGSNNRPIVFQAIRERQWLAPTTARLV